MIKAVSSMHAMIDREVELRVRPEKIFLCGFSQGGALSLTNAMLIPNRLAGAAVFNCWVPLNPDFITRIPAKPKRTLVLWLHGMSDHVVDFSAGKASLPVLAHAAVSCEFKLYPGMGHNITHKELMYLEKWIGVLLRVDILHTLCDSNARNHLFRTSSNPQVNTKTLLLFESMTTTVLS